MRNLFTLIVALSLVCCDFSAVAQENVPKYNPTLIQVADDEAVEQLKEQGVVIWYQRGDVVLALVPLRQTESVRKSRGVRHMEKGRYIVQAMDTSRTMFGADRLGRGEDLPRPYDGSGVVVGLCDTGLDPNHIAFKDAEGKLRVKKVVSFDEPINQRIVLDTPEDIATWTTDNEDNFHGTHVCNIMAGSYKANNLYGMAPGADIVMTSSLGYDVGLLAGCEEIVAYAKSVGKPAVINLSFSSYTGPKDGKSLFCRYLESLGEEAIICMAAGNAGASRMSRQMTFTENDKTWMTRIIPVDGLELRGLTDAWSKDDRPISARVHVYEHLVVNDALTFNKVYSTPMQHGEAEYSLYINSQADQEFAKYLKGQVLLEGYVNHLNNRWVTELSYLTECEESVTANGKVLPRYTLVVEYTANPGVHMDACVDLQYSKFDVFDPYYRPQSVFSISDLNTGNNVISVGMYNSHAWVKLLDGTQMCWYPTVPSINDMSSYGTLIDGRVQPLVCAPGAPVVSACSSHFLAKYPEQIPGMSAKSTVDGKDYYWNVCTGTSMASPYVAGVVACWAEAVPGLTVDDVKSALRNTNVNTKAETNNVRNGQGWLRPYEGLKYLFSVTGITEGKVDAGAPSFVLRGDVAEILNPAGTRLNVKVCDMTGIVQMDDVAEGAVSEISLANLAPGIYTLTLVRDNAAPVSRKFVRR